jgi:hypothetical protein
MTLRMKTVLLVLMVLVAGGGGTRAQEPAPAGRPGAEPGRQGGARQAPQPASLFFRETWKVVPAAVPVTQAVVTNPDLALTVYGKAPEVNNEGGVPHVWTGLCAPACAITLKHKQNMVDLSGKARMKWLAKTSGFHEIRPLVKLADGTWLVGDVADAYTFDYHESDFYFATVHWLKLDIQTLTTKGTLLDTVDLSKVDEVGFVDLTPGSGHGLGGFSDVGWIEVYGKPVQRAASTN